MELNIGTIKLPINAATKSFALLGKRGSGKTYNAAVIAEEFARVGVPFVVFDPIDVWWGLRLSADGKHRGLPVVVFGVEHADIQITRDDGARIAQAIVRDNVSCVINTFGMPKVAQRQIIKDFAEELLRINDTPRHVFIEEAHEFVPQRVMGAMGTVFAAVEALVVMGRNKGIGVTLINQRAATINKDVLTQVDTLLAFRNVAPQDRKALKDWVEAHSAEEDFEAFWKSLPSLPTGEGWIWSPEWMGVFERIKIRKRTTFHPDREKMGDKFTVPDLEATDVQDFIERFNVKPESKTQVISMPRAAGKATMIADYREQMESEFKRGYAEAEKIVRNELESQLVEKDMLIRTLRSSIASAVRALGAAIDTESDQMVPPSGIPHEANLMLAKLGGMPKRIYEILLQHPDGLTRRQIALMGPYAVTGGSFRNALSKLKTMGLTKTEGDTVRALLK